jgi:hypothetical protein
VLDRQARRSYRQQLAGLDDEIAEAENLATLSGPTGAQSERKWIVAQLSVAYGLGLRLTELIESLDLPNRGDHL